MQKVLSTPSEKYVHADFVIENVGLLLKPMFFSFDINISRYGFLKQPWFSVGVVLRG